MIYKSTSTLLLFALSAVGVSSAISVSFPGLQTLFSLFSGDFNGSKSSNATHAKNAAQMTAEELGTSRGQCHYDFFDRVTHSDRASCEPDDHWILHLLPTGNTEPGMRKAPIMVKCLEWPISREESALRKLLKNSPQSIPKHLEKDIIMSYSVDIMESVAEVLELLKPIGNTTKRDEAGRCVFVFFYTPSCVMCAHVAGNVNMMPVIFPTLRFAAIDAYRFPSFNTEFGIVGLPTFMLFHQGRPIVKFYSDARSFHAFVTRHTGIKPVEPYTYLPEHHGSLPTTPVPEFDGVVLLAWSFILIVSGYYFAQSRWFSIIVEMVKRNWRESEAQLERN